MCKWKLNLKNVMARHTQPRVRFISRYNFKLVIYARTVDVQGCIALGGRAYGLGRDIRIQKCKIKLNYKFTFNHTYYAHTISNVRVWDLV